MNSDDFHSIFIIVIITCRDDFNNSLEPITFDDITYIADKLRNVVIKKDTLHKIATKLGFEEGLEDECFKDIDTWRIPFVMIFEWERRIKQSSSKDTSEEGASKQVLARLIMEILDSIKDEKQNELLESLARKLDMHCIAIHHG